MAHQSQGINVSTQSFALPRGIVITILALMSWGLVLAAWKAVSLSFGFLLGA